MSLLLPGISGFPLIEGPCGTAPGLTPELLLALVSQATFDTPYGPVINTTSTPPTDAVSRRGLWINNGIFRYWNGTTNTWDLWSPGLSSLNGNVIIANTLPLNRINQLSSDYGKILTAGAGGPSWQTLVYNNIPLSALAVTGSTGQFLGFIGPNLLGAVSLDSATIVNLLGLCSLPISKLVASNPAGVYNVQVNSGGCLTLIAAPSGGSGVTVPTPGTGDIGKQLVAGSGGTVAWAAPAQQISKYSTTPVSIPVAGSNITIPVHAGYVCLTGKLRYLGSSLSGFNNGDEFPITAFGADTTLPHEHPLFNLRLGPNSVFVTKAPYNAACAHPITGVSTTFDMVQADWQIILQYIV